MTQEEWQTVPSLKKSKKSSPQIQSIALMHKKSQSSSSPKTTPPNPQKASSQSSTPNSSTPGSPVHKKRNGSNIVSTSSSHLNGYDAVSEITSSHINALLRTLGSKSKSKQIIEISDYLESKLSPKCRERGGMPAFSSKGFNVVEDHIKMTSSSLNQFLNDLDALDQVVLATKDLIVQLFDSQQRANPSSTHKSLGIQYMLYSILNLYPSIIPTSSQAIFDALSLFPDHLTNPPIGNSLLWVFGTGLRSSNISTVDLSGYQSCWINFFGEVLNPNKKSSFAVQTAALEYLKVLLERIKSNGLVEIDTKIFEILFNGCATYDQKLGKHQELGRLFLSVYETVKLEVLSGNAANEEKLERLFRLAINNKNASLRDEAAKVCYSIITITNKPANIFQAWTAKYESTIIQSGEVIGKMKAKKDGAYLWKNVKDSKSLSATLKFMHACNSKLLGKKGWVGSEAEKSGISKKDVSNADSLIQSLMYDLSPQNKQIFRRRNLFSFKRALFVIIILFFFFTTCSPQHKAGKFVSGICKVKSSVASSQMGKDILEISRMIKSSDVYQHVLSDQIISSLRESVLHPFQTAVIASGALSFGTEFGDTIEDNWYEYVSPKLTQIYDSFKSTQYGALALSIYETQVVPVVSQFNRDYLQPGIETTFEAINGYIIPNIEKWYQYIKDYTRYHIVPFITNLYFDYGEPLIAKVVIKMKPYGIQLHATVLKLNDEYLYPQWKTAKKFWANLMGVNSDSEKRKSKREVEVDDDSIEDDWANLMGVNSDSEKRKSKREVEVDDDSIEDDSVYPSDDSNIMRENIPSEDHSDASLMEEDDSLKLVNAQPEDMNTEEDVGEHVYDDSERVDVDEMKGPVEPVESPIVILQ